MKKKTIAILLCLVLALSLGACGEEPLTPEEAVAASVTKLGAENNYRFSMDMSMDMSIMGQTMAISMKAEGENQTDPLISHTVSTMAIEPVMSMTSEAYAAEKDGVFTVYTGVDMSALGGEGMMWQSAAVDASEMEQYDMAGSIEQFLSAVGSVTEIGEEELDSGMAMRYELVLSGDGLREALESTGGLNALAGAGLDESMQAEMETMMDEIISGMTGMTMSIWVDSESGLPVQYSMDMTELTQKMMDALMTAIAEQDDVPADVLSLEIPSVVIRMNIFDVGQVEAITIPEEALGAPEAA